MMDFFILKQIKPLLRVFRTLLYCTMEAIIYNPLKNLPDVYAILIPEIKQGGNQYGKIHSLREAFQEGKAQNGPGQAADLGRAEPRHPEAGKQQGLQQKEITGMEAGTTSKGL